MKQEVTVDSLDLLYTDTHMKLLTTIAAVLISISGFSQDYVEYENGTFSSNGKELSLDKVELIMKQYKVSNYSNIRGRMKICENKWSRIGVVSYSALATPVFAIGTPIFGIITLYAAGEGDVGGAVGSGVITVGCAAATAYFPHMAYIHSTKDRCQKKVDKLCEKLVAKLNNKIEAEYKLLGY